MREGLAIVGVICAAVGLVWLLGFSGLIFQRAAAPFAEETRRQVYQESVTGQTACQANLARIYGEWTAASPEHKRAFEAMARTEAARYRCQDLDPALAAWVGSL